MIYVYHPGGNKEDKINSGYGVNFEIDGKIYNVRIDEREKCLVIRETGDEGRILVSPGSVNVIKLV